MRERKRRAAAAVLAATLALGLAGCGNSTGGGPLGPDDFEILVDGEPVRPGMSRAEAEQALGEPIGESIRGSTVYMEYQEATVVYVVPDRSKGSEAELAELSQVYRILVSGTTQTARGIYVGASQDDVADAYSGTEAYNYYDTTIKYKLYNQSLEFRFDGGGDLTEYSITMDEPEGYTPLKWTMKDNGGKEQAIPDGGEATQDAEDPVEIEELTEKISVTMEQVERMPDGTEKVTITVQNNSNATLEYAELFVVITSDSEGDLFMQSYTIEDLLPWRGQTDTVFVDYSWDMELYYEWDENYRFSEAVETPTGGVEDEAASQTYYDALKADTLIDWRDPVTDVQYMRDGYYDWLVITFTHDVDPIAAEKIDGFGSIANVASQNGYGGLYPERVVLQYEDGTIILEKDAL